MRKTRVLIVDDSALVREVLSKGLAADPELEVVGTAQDVYVARDKIVLLKPDVITLDIEMPRMSGVEFLKRLMPQYPLPVIVCSALAAPGARATLEALRHGAVDFVLKPSSAAGAKLNEMLVELREKVKMAAAVDVSRWKREDAWKVVGTVESPAREAQDRLIAIGASAGGTVALHAMIKSFPHDMPGTVVVQHMPAVFTRIFAESLASGSRVEVAEALDREKIQAGRVLIAPGDRHLEVERVGSGFQARIRDGEKVNGHRPSVDVLFSSVARNVGADAVGVILTGMGSDGAEGLLQMRHAGARTLAQDEASCIVFGMPRAAMERGAAERLVALSDMNSAIIGALGSKRR